MPSSRTRCFRARRRSSCRAGTARRSRAATGPSGEEFERLVALYGTISGGSPAVGQADPAHAPEDDVLGRRRDASPDLGAFEAGASSALAIAPTSGPSAGGTGVAITGAGFQSGASVEIGAAAATGASVSTASFLTASTPALLPGTLNDVVVTNPDTSSTTLTDGWFSDFLDVPQPDPFHPFIETLFRAGITAGCHGGSFCRDLAIPRKQMAVLLLRSKLGAGHVPPPATGAVFLDVPASHPYAAWIEELAGLEITGGCGNGNYCPESPVTRRQMAAFLLKTKYDSSYVPPPAAGIFGDVPAGRQLRSLGGAALRRRRHRRLPGLAAALLPAQRQYPRADGRVSGQGFRVLAVILRSEPATEAAHGVATPTESANDPRLDCCSAVSSDSGSLAIARDDGQRLDTDGPRHNS